MNSSPCHRCWTEPPPALTVARPDSPSMFSANVIRSDAVQAIAEGEELIFGVRLRARAPRNGHDKDVAAGGALVAHQAFDECNALAIRRNTWSCDLKLRRVDVMHLSRARIDAVKVRNVPVCIAGAMGRRSDPSFARPESSRTHRRTCRRE